jgi:GAF domain-containing protein
LESVAPSLYVGSMSIRNGVLVNEGREVDLLHEIGRRIAAADPLHEVLGRVVEFISAVANLIRVLCTFVLRASKNSHAEVVDRLKLQVGRGITGWVAEHKRPAAVSRDAFKDPRFQSFNELPGDRFEAFLSVPVLSRDKLVGVINLKHRERHTYSQREIRLISTIGFLVDAEIEMARLEGANCELSEQLGTAPKAFCSVTSSSLKKTPTSLFRSKPPAQKIPMRSSRSHRPKRRNQARPIQVRNHLAARDQTYWRIHSSPGFTLLQYNRIDYGSRYEQPQGRNHAYSLMSLFAVLIPPFAHHR